MAQRVTLAKDLAAGSDAASVRIRSSQRPYLVASDAGYTGNVTIEHTVDGPDVTDASASWDSLGTLGANDAITIDHPIYRIRVSGDHSAGTASVYLVESVNR